mmetsp:Transcript_110234/g.344946  ORF Transcript_110234/g.344946 Transcript_110234/m.344946 type:complete len:302 (-) Transcript_110234:339-1244(-)
MLILAIPVRRPTLLFHVSEEIQDQGGEAAADCTQAYHYHGELCYDEDHVVAAPARRAQQLLAGLRAQHLGKEPSLLAMVGGRVSAPVRFACEHVARDAAILPDAVRRVLVGKHHKGTGLGDVGALQIVLHQGAALEELHVGHVGRVLHQRLDLLRREVLEKEDDVHAVLAPVGVVELVEQAIDGAKVLVPRDDDVAQPALVVAPPGVHGLRAHHRHQLRDLLGDEHHRERHEGDEPHETARGAALEPRPPEGLDGAVVQGHVEIHGLRPPGLDKLEDACGHEDERATGADQPVDPPPEAAP